MDGKQQLEVAKETTSERKTGLPDDANLSYTVPTDISLFWNKHIYTEA